MNVLVKYWFPSALPPPPHSSLYLLLVFFLMFFFIPTQVEPLKDHPKNYPLVLTEHRSLVRPKEFIRIEL